MRFRLLTAFIALVIVDVTLPAARAQGSDAELPLRGNLPVPVEAEPQVGDLEVSHGEKWHHLTLCLHGSLCPACLIELQNKLRKLPGIAYAKISYKSNANEHEKQKRKSAPGVIIFDEHTVDLNKLKHFLADNHYHSSELSDEIIAAEKAK